MSIPEDIFEEWEASSQSSSVFHFDTDDNTTIDGVCSMQQIYTAPGTVQCVQSVESAQYPQRAQSVHTAEQCVDLGFESEMSFVALGSEELSDLMETV